MLFPLHYSTQTTTIITTGNQSDLILPDRTTHGGFCHDSELSSHLCAETIYAGANPAEPGNQTKARTRNYSGTRRRLANAINNPIFIVSLSYSVGLVYVAIRTVGLRLRTPHGN